MREREVLGALQHMQSRQNAGLTGVVSKLAGVMNAEAIIGQPFQNSATLDQTDLLKQIIAWCKANSYGGEIIFPAKDIAFTGPLEWSGAGPAVAYPGRTYKRRKYPTIVGQWQSTRFILLNANANAVGFAFDTSADDASGGTVSMRDCDFVGPGLSVQKTTLAANAAAGNTISVVDNVVSPGDALLLYNGAHEFWTQAQAVTGTGPYTVTLGNPGNTVLPDTRQQILSGTTFVAGGTVLVYKQSRLVQVGGYYTRQTSVHGNCSFVRCGFWNAFQALCFDNTTTVQIDQCKFTGCCQQISTAGNTDEILINLCDGGSDWPEYAATLTAGNPVITVTSGTGGLMIGASLYQKPSSTASSTVLNLPEGTRILSISGNQVTLSEAPTTGGSVSLHQALGTMWACGQGAASFSGNANLALNATTDITFINPMGGRMEQLYYCADAICNGVTVIGGYLEASKRIARMGVIGGSGGGARHTFTGLQFENIDYCSGPAIHVASASPSLNLDIKVSSVAVTGAQFPLVQTPSATGSVRIAAGSSWKNVNLDVNQMSWGRGNGANGGPTVQMAGGGDSWSALPLDSGGNGTLREFRASVGATPFYDLCGAYVKIQNVTGTNAWSWNWPGVSQVELNLTGNTTNIGGINWGASVPPRGVPLVVHLVQGGSGNYTTYFNPTHFANLDGSAIGTAGTPLTGGAAGTSMRLYFVSNGSKYILQHAVPAWS